MYFFLGWYFEQILPKEFGSRKVPYFIITEPIQWIIKKFKQYSQQRYEKETLVSTDVEDNFKNEDEEEIEDEDVKKEREMIYQNKIPDNVGVLICDLRKVYAGDDGNLEKVAVHKLCLSIFKGECFGLLGPNGAGKTTTISILTGMYLPTSGSAKIGGYDVTLEMDAIRKNLGVCPQVKRAIPFLFKNLFY